LPKERKTLPSRRDPKTKVPFWTILKDLIGKDLTKVSLPVYFNEPIALTQKIAETCEYNELLDQAAHEAESQRRLALIASYMISRSSTIVGRL
jgi:hypothetical protein